MIDHNAPLPEVPIERFLHRYRSAKRRERLRPLYELMLEEARHLAQPATVQAEFAAETLVELASWFQEDTVAAVLAVCTIGSLAELEIVELFAQEEPHLGMILDEVCLQLVSGMARAIHAGVRQAALARGLRVGPPYRPGLGRWPMEAQRAIFDRLPAEEIRVTLSEELIMRPLKSTSLIIPLRTP
ncbi:MAG: hypothetical protein RRC07_05185 [Anaerolineae bacterium]|nr:hypothetical protein [Anaerolineae bacterium]